MQTGGPGGATSVFIRGANANHTKVLIDGIDAGDPSAGGAFDFSHVPTFDVERIEVLRGPQSGLYGSDAIGGVVNIITAKGRGPAQVRGLVEGGAFEPSLLAALGEGLSAPADVTRVGQSVGRNRSLASGVMCLHVNML